MGSLRGIIFLKCHLNFHYCKLPTDYTPWSYKTSWGGGGGGGGGGVGGYSQRACNQTINKYFKIPFLNFIAFLSNKML